MAIEFVVETGAGLATATSYLSVADMKQLWDNVGYDYSDLTDDEIMQKLNKATEVIDAQYLTLWPGKRNSTTQRLEWPRDDAEYIDETEIDDDVVPPEVERAVSEMVYAMESGVVLQPTHDSKGTISKETVKVDVIEQSSTYTEYSSQDIMRTTIVAVVDALARLIGSGESSAFPSLDIQRV